MDFRHPFFTRSVVITIAGFIQEGRLINDNGRVNNQGLKADFMSGLVFQKLDIILLYLSSKEFSTVAILSKNNCVLLVRSRI